MTDFKIQPIVARQLPEFVREDHPALVSFLETYYEWLEGTYAPISPLEIGDAYDIDDTVDEFIDYFQTQYLKDFPINLAQNPDGSTVNRATLVKNIKDFYRSKGSESSYKFLFHLIFGVDVETYLPKDDILTASGSKYIRQISIRLTNTLGNDIFKSVGQIITQFDPTNTQEKASARVERVIIYREGDFDIAELYLADIQGSFENTFPVRFTKNNISYQEQYTYPMVVSVSIDIAGTGYQVGDIVNISGDGLGATAEVSRVGNIGDIKSIRMVDFGANYTSASVSITREDVSDSSYIDASGTASIGPVAHHAGFYDTEKGHISTNKVLQDNVYYQPYSYVLKSEIVISRYKEIIKNLVHPAGFAFFGSVHISRCFTELMSSSNQVNNIFTPRLAHYTPYTWNEATNLDDDYPNGYFSPNIGATRATLGNPDGDPFWVINKHPSQTKVRFGDIVIGDFIIQDAGFLHTCSTIEDNASLIIT